MDLTKTFAAFFSKKIRSRGNSYYYSGRVHIRQATADSVRATVRGTRNYPVSLQVEKDALRVKCTCPYFQDWPEVCKHIWATILAAEARGYLKTVLLNRITRIRFSHSKPFPGDNLDDGLIDDEDDRMVVTPTRQPSYHEPRRTRPRQSSWEESLNQIAGSIEIDTPARPARLTARQARWPAGREILYVLDVPATLSAGILIVETAWRQRKQNGEWSKSKTTRLSPEQIARLPNPDDRRIIAILHGAKEDFSWGSYYSNTTLPFRFRVAKSLSAILIPLMCRTGRCGLRLSPEDDSLEIVSWDEGDPWEFWLAIRPNESNKHYLIQGSLRRGKEQMELGQPVLLLAGGLVFTRTGAARLNDAGAFGWISLLRRQPTVSIPRAQGDKLMERLMQFPRLPPLDLPEKLKYEQVLVSPQPRLTVRTVKRQGLVSRQILSGALSFNYQGQVITADDPRPGIFLPASPSGGPASPSGGPASPAGGASGGTEPRRLLRRDLDTEGAATELLRQLGFRIASTYDADEYNLQIVPGKFPKAARILLAKGWHIEAKGKPYRQSGPLSLNVTTGIDWFNLAAKVAFGEEQVGLPRILAAIKRGENMVQLGDGSFGLFPEEWLKKYGLLVGLGRPQGDELRFSKSQVCLLDTLLAAQPAARCDEAFTRARDELKSFAGVKPVEPPDSFVGKLRPYQTEGLGWLVFLQRFGFGGCLADDMGLGKTVQVLALLATRSHPLAYPDLHRGAGRHPGKRPSLVVVPKSLIFNWQQEAARFTPQIKVIDYTGSKRRRLGEHFSEYDLILTTYGTIRRDIAVLKDIHFDYCILDEAQAIKNERTASARAARLLNADHRLALSGTPIENHLGELWSLFEFLNPGMLGTSSVFRFNTAVLRNPDEETRSFLGRGLRPFILRRTKNQVARDLPPKTEQTIYCELGKGQKELYKELLSHYQMTLLNRVKREGINKLKMHILEALLRLRQVACHPGLIDKSRTEEPSAKLDTLLPQLTEVIEGGHKVLVFSQFTSLLSIVRARLERDKIVYEYLDGRTRHRAECVARFQNDPVCRLFLISLKAGGLGLNLTAAEYVFLLDPWWNPAVEVQAIDRTHRIGQTQPVFAYRLIARDTVEEKVLELQQHKRDLVNAIINADNSLIRKLSRADLEILLS